MLRLVGFLIIKSQADLAFAASVKTDGILGWISQHIACTNTRLATHDATFAINKHLQTKSQ